jgi:hypothetical protein
VNAGQKPDTKAPYNTPQLTVYGPINVLTQNRSAGRVHRDNNFNPNKT